MAMKDKPISKKKERFISLPIGMEKKKARKGFCNRLKKLFKKSEEPERRVFHVKRADTQAE